MELCIEDVKAWLSANFLMLNDSKTEFMVFSSGKSKHEIEIENLTVGDSTVCVQSQARSLGVIFDSKLSMSQHVSNVCKTAFYHLRTISRIRKYLSNEDCEKLVHAFISSRLDSCNSLLYGLPKKLLSKLQRIQNTAARIITRKRKFDHITPVLIHLHWLPVEQRVTFKLLCIFHKCHTGNAPTYLSSLVKQEEIVRVLRSNDDILYEDKRSGGFGDRAFQYAAPRLWNVLPIDIKSARTYELFKSHLKTYLFRKAFKDYL